MNCFSKDALTEFYEGLFTEDQSQEVLNHIALCSSCSDQYFDICEQYTDTIEINLKNNVMHAITAPIVKTTPLSKTKLLSLYTVAACIALSIYASGTFDTIFHIANNITEKAQEYSQKYSEYKYNYYMEELKNGNENKQK